MTELKHDDSGEFDDKDVVYEISTFGADFDVDGLVKRFDRGDIYVPTFQRKFVWPHKQASRFIESILLGLPIPSVFLYKEDDTRKNLIVDGRQRLTTLHAFKTGLYPETDSVFRLIGVKDRFERKSYTELSEEDKRRFNDSIIHAMIIQQSHPENSNSAVYHIFDRLNSNGTPAQPQEIRAAIYHGRLQDQIESLNKFEYWRKIFGPINKRGKDQELILRFFALLEGYSSYKKPMGDFLNEFMRKERHNIIDQNLFKNTCHRISEAIGDKAFRIKNSLNVAIYDAFMVGVALSENISNDQIRQVYINAVEEKDFLKHVEKATSDEANVRGRIEYVRAKLNA